LSADAIAIRLLHDLQEFERCIELQKLIWDFADADLVPVPMFVVAAKIGGQVAGAFDGDTMIGFVLAVPGYRHGRAYLHSHMTAVLPEYQGKGIGRRLKLRQRADALDRGIELVEWTFDPLEFRNAHFNLERLGVIVRRYVRNQYGVTSSPLHGGLPTDRLVAEWWLASPRVKALIEEQQPPKHDQPQRVHIPAAIHEMKKTDHEAALRLQSEIRAQFELWLGQGYAITGFEHEARGGTYLLEPYQEKR
jgi:predicted GNAT superfamily acetyltransferase